MAVMLLQKFNKFYWMSILLIGQKNMNNYHSPYFSNDKNEIGLVQREKKLKQEQYRLDLIEQMNQKYQKLKQSKEDSQSQRLKYQRVYTEETNNPKPVSRGQRPLTYQRLSRLNEIQNRISFQKMGKRPPFQFNSFEKNSKQQENQFLQNRNGIKYQQRLRTQNLYEKSPFESIVSDLQERRRQLSDYQDKKIGEVYDKMYDSVQILNSINGSSFKPHNADFEKRYNRNVYKPPKYRINNHKYGDKYAINPQQQVKPYKLPPLTKDVHLSRSIDESQRNWRQWYAKEKLRQLQSYYNKIVSNKYYYEAAPSKHFNLN